MSAAVYLASGSQVATNVEDAWSRAYREENISQFPNRELISHIDYWFYVVHNRKWESWITEKVRFALVEAAKLKGPSSAVEVYGESTYPNLDSQELIALYRLFNSHNLTGNKSLMVEGGALAARLTSNLEVYITSTIARTRPAVASELSRALFHSDPNANLGHLVPKLTSNLQEGSKPIFGVSLEGKANCWALSAMQMVQHLPSLRRALMEDPEFNREEFAPFKEFVREYTRAQETAGYTPNINLQNIRLALVSRGIPENPQETADAAEALNFLLERLNPGRSVVNLIQTTNQSSQISMPMGIISLPIVFADGKPIPFMEMFQSYFDEEPSIFINEFGVETQRFERRRFHQAPNEFLVQLTRLTYGPRKINDQVPIPQVFQLPEGLILSGMRAEYECDMFIRHHGDVQGHYFIYIRRPDGWWKADNEKVEKVPDDYALLKMAESTIFHFKRV